LPPTPQEVEAFLKDSSPRAFEKVIDRLLASPHYGERWGRHWLDVVRYADTAGDNSDFPIAAGFRYRNYVIKSFNQDKPYDRFIREQIAGDLLPARTEAERHEGIIATGYLAMSRRFGSRNKEFNLTIEDTIDNLGKTFLGLSVSCARCHDHKYDPIPQRDYYALYGIFNSSRYAFPGAEIYPHPADMIPLATGAPAGSFTRWQRELTELDDRKEQLTSERGNAARNRAQKEREAKQSAEAKGEAKVNESGNGQSAPKAVATTYPPYRERPADFDRDAMNSSLVRGSLRTSEEIDAELAQVKARITGLGNQVPLVEKAYAVVEGHPANARLHRKGDPKLLGDEVPRGFLQILGGRRLPDGYGGSGRDQLAGWIADPANPLTARVLVNRIWEYHFGKGIVTTPNDFGVRGQAPSHPELLDYLAARFISGGWSIKKMHRLIMTSRVYQLSVADQARNARVDLANAWYWRFDRRRLSAEEIRDAMLAVSGALDPTIGGAHPFPPERDWRFTQHKQFFALYDHNRRSVYLMQQRLRKHPLMEVFDGPDTNSSTALRPLSTTPVQALYLMNDPFVHAQADRFATRVILASPSLPERIDYACRLAYGRAASPREVSEAAAYIAQLSGELEEANAPEDGRLRAAFASYLRVLLSSNEFLYLD
jgi:hypothetical protein